MRWGPRRLRRHVAVVAVPGIRTRTVVSRTPAPEISIAVRRHPAPGRETFEPVRR